MSGRVMKTNLKRLEDIAYGYRNEPLSEWPCVRDLAKQFGVRQSEIIELVENSEVLDMVEGVQIGGGGGHAEFVSQGDYLIEWVGE